MDQITIQIKELLYSDELDQYELQATYRDIFKLNLA